MAYLKDSEVPRDIVCLERSQSSCTHICRRNVHTPSQASHGQTKVRISLQPCMYDRQKPEIFTNRMKTGVMPME